MGELDKDMYDDFVSLCTNKKSLNTINQYIDLLDIGLANPEYDLNNDKYTLDSLSIDSLIDSYKGKDLYFIIWSAEFAGSTIISELPSIIDFTDRYQREIETIYLCIDNSEHKNLWATRIIDNNWVGKHYFLSAENHDNVINRFSAQKISSFCDGGVTYTLIDKNGHIVNNIERPIELTNDKIETYFLTSAFFRVTLCKPCYS